MDVVKTNIEKLGGHLDIESEAGSGTTVRIRLPLTLAIIPSLIVGASGHRFAVPQVNVKELVRVRAGDTAQRIEMVGDAEVLRLRGSLLPLLRLSDVLDLERFFTHPGTGVVMQDRRNRLTDRRAPKPDTALKNTALKNTDPQGHVGGKRRNKADRRQSWHSDLSVVILRMGLHRFGLAVDDLYDTEEIVVKPLSKHIKECKCFAGATIMGDGTVAMILDAAGIADFKKLRFSEIGAEERRRREAARKARSNKGDRKSVLLFNNAPDEFFAMQLEKIARLEKIKPDAIHRAGGSSYMDYRGEGLSLIYLDRILPVKPVPRDTDELFVIIPKLNGSQGGIVVSKIVDAIETDVTIKQDPTTPPGIEGSAFVQGRLTQFLNPGHLLELLGKKGMNG